MAEIRREVLPKVNAFLSEQVNRIKEQKRKTATALINSFPQFLFIRDNMENFVNGLKPAAKTNEEVFIEMARTRYRRQGQVRSLSQDIAKQGVMSAEIEGKVEKYREMIREDQKGILAEYVLRRKGVLDIFDSLQEWKSAEDKKHHRESAIHSLICPMGVDSIGMEFEQHNLWLVDDRLAFFAYYNSDQQLSKYTDLKAKDRPDIAFFYDTCFSWRGEGEASNTVVIIEFKRPDRDDYTGNDNPIRQINEYVQKLRRGHLENVKGRVPPRRLREAAYHCYIIADRTATFEKEIEMLPFTETPDGEGLFGYIGSGDRKAYVEIIPYDKLLRDAKLRQGIFFQKLGLTDLDTRKGTPPPPTEPADQIFELADAEDDS